MNYEKLFRFIRTVLVVLITVYVMLLLTGLAQTDIQNDAEASEDTPQYIYRAVDIQPIKTLPIISNEKSYTDEDLNQLAHLLMAECGADYVQDVTLYMTGSVVINRYNNGWADSIRKVINQGSGVSIQYSTAPFYMSLTPTQRCWDIAEDLLKNGSVLPSNVIYQSNFKQGSGVYAYVDTVYFCYE